MSLAGLRHKASAVEFPSIKPRSTAPTVCRCCCWVRGNEIVARYRIAVGRRICSAGLVADELHARTDGFTSLAVLVGAGAVALGWKPADPTLGLFITVAMLGILRSAVRQVGPGSWMQWTRTHSISPPRQS